MHEAIRLEVVKLLKNLNILVEIAIKEANKQANVKKSK